MSELNYINSKKNIILYLVLIITLGLGLRLYYFPYDVPIATDGFYSFVYAVKTVFDSSLPVGYTTTNTGWSNFLSLFFVFSDTSNTLHLMDIQRILSIILSTITIIPAFFIFRRFVDTRWALFGSFLLVVEPRLLLMSLEGINYLLFFFLFVLTIALFLKKTDNSLFLSFACISCAALVRYEGLLLLIPLSIMYFLKFKDKRSIVRFLGMIFVLIIILVSVASIRMEATENLCYESYVGTICGQDGISHNILGAPMYIEKHVISGIPDLDDKIYNKTGISALDKFTYLSLSNLVKFLGLSLIPFFIFFMILRFGIFIKNIKFPKLDFDKVTILLTTCIMLLPAIYAYGRGIEEIRYVLIIIPILCILSISGISLISFKISKNNGTLIVLIMLIMASSIIFIELEKRDSTHDRESFLVSQKIVELTDVTNTFHQSGYVKTAVLSSNWPALPEAGQNGKLVSVFQKISIKNYHDLEEFIVDSEKSGLKYLVIDKDNELFTDLHVNPAKYPYLVKKFDSDDFDYTNQFSIYEIKYEKMI
jgi:hypothetical protein